MSTKTAQATSAAFAMQRWAEITHERLVESYMKKVKHEGQGLESISSIVNVSESGGSATFYYNYYLMFVDMGVGRGVKIDDVRENKIARALEGSGAGSKRKAKKWYSPVIGREYFKLGPILQDIYGNKAIKTVIEEIPSNLNVEL